LPDEEDGQIIKKIAAYHQFHAVREAVERVVEASRPDGDRKGGVVWHTQGAGKSIEMACLSGKLLTDPRMENPTLVIVTDRQDLDGQLLGSLLEQAICWVNPPSRQIPDKNSGIY